MKRVGRTGEEEREKKIEEGKSRRAQQEGGGEAEDEKLEKGEKQKEHMK